MPAHLIDRLVFILCSKFHLKSFSQLILVTFLEYVVDSVLAKFNWLWILVAGLTRIEVIVADLLI